MRRRDGDDDAGARLLRHGRHDRLPVRDAWRRMRGAQAHRDREPTARCSTRDVRAQRRGQARRPLRAHVGRCSRSNRGEVLALAHALESREDDHRRRRRGDHRGHAWADRRRAALPRSVVPPDARALPRGGARGLTRTTRRRGAHPRAGPAATGRRRPPVRATGRPPDRRLRLGSPSPAAARRRVASRPTTPDGKLTRHAPVQHADARASRRSRPSIEGHVTIYTCGPTVYRSAHLGNLRTFMLGDLIRRGARVRGLPGHADHEHHRRRAHDRRGLARGGRQDGARRRRTRACRRSRSPRSTRRRCSRTRTRSASGPPNRYPKATEHIPEMIELTQASDRPGPRVRGGLAAACTSTSRRSRATGS